jgi:protein tyrosine phosphatase (PTP) superfamily phosphohydrolase (DUF442 family)
MSANEISNFIPVSDHIYTSGQPTADQLRRLAAEGFSSVVNLATPHSPQALPGEADLVRSLGMGYDNIPVEWENPLESDYALFEQIMGRLPPGKTLIHCIANYRVTAFYALYAQAQLGWSEPQADQFMAPVWQTSEYPIWKAFIARMRQRLAGSHRTPPGV